MKNLKKLSRTELRKVNGGEQDYTNQLLVYPLDSSCPSGKSKKTWKWR
jgi:hypothetical protein